MRPAGREGLAVWSVAEGVSVGARSLFVVWAQLLLGRRAVLDLLAAVRAERTRVKRRTEGTERAEGIGREGLAMEGGSYG